MRLICPNCDAQYEVDAAMIPASGRDVQCSSCGKTWFQAPQSAEPAPAEPAPEDDLVGDMGDEHPDPSSEDGLGQEAAEFFAASMPDLIDEERIEEDTPEPGKVEEELADSGHLDTGGIPTPPEDGVQSEPEDTATAHAESAQEEEPREDPDQDADGDSDEDEADDLPPRRPIDPSVLGILRAEAEREIAARRAERGLMESQGDLGLEDPARRSYSAEETEARTARLRGSDSEEAHAPDRKALLPDVDDINASLAATSDRDDAYAASVRKEEVRKRQFGFRMGFSIVLLAVAAVILVYVWSPEISEAVPSLKPALSSYVDWANGIRIRIDELLARSVESLQKANGG